MLTSTGRAALRSGARLISNCGSKHQASPSLSVFFMSTTRSHHSESYENILVETKPSNDGQPGVGIVTLNRPKALNALSSQLFGELLHATEAMEEDPSIGCMIVTGSSKAFAAGADISEMQSKTFEENALSDWIASWHDLANRRPNTPIIAAVSGFALGGGCELAMMCDFIVCDKTAKFGQPEINLGVIAGAGGTQRLTKLIGRSKSMYLNLTGGEWLLLLWFRNFNCLVTRLGDRLGDAAVWLQAFP
jgi:enoyl-CoA hydratase/carnithine racemase